MDGDYLLPALTTTDRSIQLTSRGKKLENEWFATALADICVRSASELISVIVTRMTSTPLRNNDQNLIASFGLEDF
jgi:hypothetical protein